MTGRKRKAAAPEDKGHKDTEEGLEALAPPPDALPDNTLEAFLKEASEALAETDEEAAGPPQPPGSPDYRRLKVIVSPDRMEARLKAVFPSSTLEEIQDALKQSQVAWGIREDALKQALECAGRTGHVVRDALVAKGKPAVYLKRKEVRYHFLEEVRMPETGKPVHLASRPFREIHDLLGRTDIEMIRGYGRPVMAAARGEALMQVEGEDEIEPGRDVFGKEAKEIHDSAPEPLKPGDGVVHNGGAIIADRFGYISARSGFLCVLSPIWVSPDRMNAYFVNPPQVGKRKAPDAEELLRQLEEVGVCFGVDEKLVREMCRDLELGEARESCAHIAKGQPPRLAKGQAWFAFEPLPAAPFEALQNAFDSLHLEDVTAFSMPAPVVNAGTVIVEQAHKGTAAEPGTDLWGQPVAQPDEKQERKVYKAGPNVRREVAEGSLRYVSEIYGYAGVLGDRIMVVSPVWVAPDRMGAHFVAFPQPDRVVRPSMEEVDALLERAALRHGVNRQAVHLLCGAFPVDRETEGARAALLAEGTPPEPGVDGQVRLLFKQMPEPGKMLEGGQMDFRERDAVPQVTPGEVLARRSFPTPGKPGVDVRGRVLNPPKNTRGLLYAGPNVTVEEVDGKQVFRAASAGWARVIKDALSVAKRFRVRGNLDYKVGNVKVDGEVEIEGIVKSRFHVEATGDVIIGGSVERGASVMAGGAVVVHRGILGAKVKAGGNLYVRFAQESELEVGGDLLVRNYLQDCQVSVIGKAVVQGNEGGQRQLCLLGGTLFVGSEIEAASIGSAFGRKNRVVVGISVDIEKRLEKYQKGKAYSELNIRRIMRTLGTALPGGSGAPDLTAAIMRAPPGRREFLVRQVKDLQNLQNLRTSLDYHLGELRRERDEFAKSARIRVPGTAFARIALQIQDSYKILEESVSAVTFRLHKDGHGIAQELM